jgi:protein phosphatase
MRGQAEMIMGNHERKIARWISQGDRAGRHGAVRLSDGNRVTTDRLGELSALDRRRWQGRFRGLVAHAAPMRVLGNVILSHASVHPGYFDETASAREIETYATFGEFETSPEGEGGRRYTWTQSVPAGVTAIVGHDIRSMAAPYTEANGIGGTSIFLDTGSGKGGPLSSVDLKFVGDGALQVANFNMY